MSSENHRQAIACTFIYPEVTQRFHPFPIAGRGQLRFTTQGVELRGFHPAWRLPSTVKGCLALLLLYVPGWLLLDLTTNTDPGSSSVSSDGIAELGGAAGMILLAGLVAWLSKQKAKARIDQPLQERIPWSRVWHLEVRGFRYTTLRSARPGDLRFSGEDITPSDHRNEGIYARKMQQTTLAAQGSSNNFRLIVGRWGRRREIRFETVAPVEELMETLRTMQVDG